MATLVRAGSPVVAPDPPQRGSRVAAWLSEPRQALLSAVLILVAAVGLDALSDPDVWWHIKLGDWIIAHHQIPAGELFAYTAFGNPLVVHEWLSETIFAALSAVGGLVLVTAVMGAVAWSGMLATLLRGRLRGAGPVVLAIGLVLGARVAEPVLGTRPQVFTFALVCWTLWIAEFIPALRGSQALVAAPALPALGEPPRGLHRGHRVSRDRARRRGDQAPLVARDRGATATDHRSRACDGRLSARGVREPIWAVALRLRRDDGSDRAREGHHRVAVTELRRSRRCGCCWRCCSRSWR